MQAYVDGTYAGNTYRYVKAVHVHSHKIEREDSMHSPKGQKCGSPDIKELQEHNQGPGGLERIFQWLNDIMQHIDLSQMVTRLNSSLYVGLVWWRRKPLADTS